MLRLLLIALMLYSLPVLCSYLWQILDASCVV
jgi:hypothetical protein